jgi:hypothetical protein
MSFIGLSDLKGKDLRKDDLLVLAKECLSQVLLKLDEQFL